MRTATIPQVDPTLTTQMKSVGEAMATGRTSKESLQKCLRSPEIGCSGLRGDGKPWRIGTEIYGDRDILPRDVISRKLSVPNAERIFFIRHARRASFTPAAILDLTKIDRWLSVQGGVCGFCGRRAGAETEAQRKRAGSLRPWNAM